MERNKIYIIIICILSVLLIISSYFAISPTHKINIVTINDTTYNHKILDSIKYNIIIRDSIIIKYKQKEYEEIIKANNLTDSASVDLFYELLSE